MPTYLGMGAKSKWYLVTEKRADGQSVPKIKRYSRVSNRTVWERYPAKSYRNLPANELELFLKRINATAESERKLAEERYDFHHTYINKRSLERFETNLRKNVTDKAHIGHTIHLLHAYVFEFFILKCELPDPSHWHLKDDQWGEWLLKKELKPATLKKIVSTANRFNKFLVSTVFPDMPTPRALEPIGKVKLSKLTEAQRQRRKLITDERFVEILEHAKNTDPGVIPNMKLAYDFGLRISETLGLSKEKFLKSALLVDAQGEKIKDGQIKTKQTKTLGRMVPYWNMTAKDAWSLVKQIEVQHPDTLIKRVNAVLGKFDHNSHDFRRSFITKMLRTKHFRDVQQAAGHTNIKTTMDYAQDDRQLSDELADLD